MHGSDRTRALATVRQTVPGRGAHEPYVRAALMRLRRATPAMGGAATWQTSRRRADQRLG